MNFKNLGENRDPALVVREVSRHAVRFLYYPPSTQAETAQAIIAAISAGIISGTPSGASNLRQRPSGLTDGLPYLNIGFLPESFPDEVNPTYTFNQALASNLPQHELDDLNGRGLKGVRVQFENGLSELIINRPPRINIRQEGGKKTKHDRIHGFVERHRGECVFFQTVSESRRFATNSGRFLNTAEWTMTYDEAIKLVPGQYLGSLKLGRGIDRIYRSFGFSTDGKGNNCLHNGWYSIPFQRPKGIQWQDPAFRLIRPLKAIPLFAWSEMIEVAEGCDLDGLMSQIGVAPPDDLTAPHGQAAADDSDLQEAQPLDRKLYRAGARDLAFVGPFMIAKGKRNSHSFWIVDTNVTERALRIFRTEEAAYQFAISGTGWIVPNDQMVARIVHYEGCWTQEVDRVLDLIFGPAQ